ncbi:Uncharacterised protein [Corynebacterium matruchotii]|nr:Uncharacterised protein [Corynebacterium matruchotii]
MGGTTSACAENTNDLTNQLLKIRNYLRVRGEYTTIEGKKAIKEELPPRARRILL